MWLVILITPVCHHAIYGKIYIMNCHSVYEMIHTLKIYLKGKITKDSFSYL